MAENFNSTFNEDFTELFQLSKFQVQSLVSFCLSKDFNYDSVSCISSSYVAIALENNIYVYKEDAQELFWQHTFDSICDCVGLSDDLCILLVVERPGKLHLMHIPSSKIIYSYECGENGSLCTVQNVICSSSLPGFLSIYIFTKECILFEFTKIESLSLNKALEDDKISEFFSTVNVKRIDLNMLHDFSSNSAIETFSQAFPLGLEGEIKFDDISATDYYAIEDIVDGDFTTDFEWNSEEMKLFKFDVTGYGEMKKILCTRDGRYVVCLDQKHMLLIFSAFTHLNLAVWGDGDIKDFTLYDTIDPATSSISDSKIGIIRQNEDGHMFEARKFPSFEFIHKMQLSEFVQLVKGKPNQDFWYIIEGNKSIDNESYNLNVMSVSESSPEARLMSLLKRRKFKEAEKYAKLHNLNDEIIFRTQLTCMFKESANLSVYKQEFIWNEVERCLNKIKDVDFIKSCLSFLEPDMEIMRKLHTCINNWLTTNNIEGAEDLICEINENENKLLTFNVLPKSVQLNLTLKKFLSKDMLQFMISELREGCLNVALIIWQRHKDDILSSLTLEQVQEILNAIPGDIPSLHLITFLKEDFLPFVLIKLPEAVDIIADWIISHIHLLELTEKELWPENGDQLASIFVESIESLLEKATNGAINYSTSIYIVSVHKKLMDNDSRIGCLFGLSKTLKLLVKLKKMFNCKISLTVFEDSKLDVMFAVLDRVNIKYVSEAIHEFVRPYTIENNLDFDLSLELYIKNTLKTSYFTWWSSEEAPWEEHLTIVLECILDPERWAKAALMIVSHAVVPWTDRIKKIVERGLNSDHASKEEFQENSKKIVIKETLKKYEIRNFPLGKDMELIYTLVNYILKQNRQSALEDAKKVMLSYCDSLTFEAYRNILQFFINQNKLDEFTSLIASIPDDISVECCNSLICYISLFLESDCLVKNSCNQVETFLDAGIYLFEFLKMKKQPVDKDLFGALRCMQKLLKEFDMHVTICDVRSKENALKIVERFIHSVLDKMALSEKLDKTSASLGIFRIKRLGCILDLEMAYVMDVLITNCLQRKMHSLVVELCGELISTYPVSSNSETLIEVVNHFAQHFQNIKNMNFGAIIDSICHLSNTAITHCNNDNIRKYIYVTRLSTYFAFLSKITGQQPSVLSGNTGIYYKWRFNLIYEDDGFQLDFSQVVDFVSKLLPLFLRHSRGLHQALAFPMKEVFSVIFEPIIIHMKHKGQEVAALRTMYQFYHLQAEFLENEAGAQEAFSLIASYVKDSIKNLLRSLIDKRKPDMDLSIGLLSIFSNEKSDILMKLKRWSAKDLRCIMTLGEIGSECCCIFRNSEFQEYETMYRRALLLLKQNIKITQTDMAFNSSDSDYNWSIAKEMILCPKTNLSTIFEFCHAFNFVTNHVLIAYLNNLLIEAEKLCLTNKEIPGENLQSLLNRTKCAIEVVSSEELIVKNLESLLKKISPYSYEILIFIHEELLCYSADVLTVTSGQFEKVIAFLNFLKVYQRISPPGETELEQWISMHPADAKLPEIANKRLPLSSMLNNISYKIINPELTATTLTVWFTIAPLLNVCKDDLVMIAVKNIVTAYLKKQSTKPVILNQDKAFLQNIAEMLGNISEVERCVVCASWVANRMPPGVNKVCCCRITLEVAKKWHEEYPNDRKSSDVLKKSKELYQQSSIEKLLYQSNLANDVSLSYSQNPEQLVEYFTEEFCFSAESSIKVCRVAVDIAKVVIIDLEKIFKKKLMKWLYTSQISSNFDETFAFNDSTENIEDGDDKNLLKVINLLLGVSSVNYNICHSLKEDFSTMTLFQRSRLIFCLVGVYGYEFVAQSLSIPSQEFKETMPVFLCSAELEHLHLRSSSDMELTFNIEFIQNILSNWGNNSKVLLCAVKICLENNIWSSHIWEIILQRLVMLSMAESLQDILHTAQGHLAHMWHNKSFILAWNYIISHCYKNEFANTSKIVEKLYKTILCCPCVSSLDVKLLWNDLKCFVKSINGQDLKEVEPISNANAFIQALKSLQETCVQAQD